MPRRLPGPPERAQRAEQEWQFLPKQPSEYGTLSRNFENLMSFFLGIDGGGTSTRCGIATDSEIVARSAGPSSKVSVVGAGLARAALRAAIEEACEKAGIQPNQIRQTCIGLAGAARTPVVTSIREILEEIVGGAVEVVGDMVIALESGVGPGPGMIVIAGTGSICFGRDSRGETARAGGWGPESSDEGSGTWIGRQAVSAALRAHDSGQNTSLLFAVLKSWRVGSRDELSQKANSIPPPDFSLLAPSVFESARAGDHLASGILDRAGIELADLAFIVARRLWPATQNMTVCPRGGVFLHCEQVRNVFLREFKAKCPEAQMVSAEVDPVAGAIAMARRAWAQPKTPQKRASF